MTGQNSVAEGVFSVTHSCSTKCSVRTHYWLFFFVYSEQRNGMKYIMLWWSHSSDVMHLVLW